MSLYGGLNEHTRRNERVERGLVSVPAVAGLVTIGFTSTQTVNITPAAGAMGGMRQMTHFALTIDDQGIVATNFTGITNTASVPGALVTGSLNTLGTILTIRVWTFTSNSNPTLVLGSGASGAATLVRYEIWGNLNAGVVDVTKVTTAQTIAGSF